VKCNGDKSFIRKCADHLRRGQV